MRSYRRHFAVFAAALMLLPVIMGFTGCTQTYEGETKVFGAFSCKMRIYGGKANKAAKEIEAALKRFDEIVSTTDTGSAVYKFNEDKTDGKKHEIDELVYDMGMKSKDIYEDGGGAYNPAVYPLMELWGLETGRFYGAGHTAPTPAKIGEVLAYCDYDLITFTEESGKYYVSAVYGECKIDFGAYAKGYALDIAVGILEKYNAGYAILDIAGHAYFYGAMPERDVFYVGISYPDLFLAGDPDFAFCTVETKAAAAITSGTYVRYFMMDSSGEQKANGNNVVVPHTIDSRKGLATSGYPIGVLYGGGAYSNDPRAVVSATVFHESAALADAYATVVSVFGFDEGKKFLEDRGLSGILITFESEEIGGKTYDGRYAAVGVKIIESGLETRNLYKDFIEVP